MCNYYTQNYIILKVGSYVILLQNIHCNGSLNNDCLLFIIPDVTQNATNHVLFIIYYDNRPIETALFYSIDNFKPPLNGSRHSMWKYTSKCSLYISYDHVTCHDMILISYMSPICKTFNEDYCL